MKKHLLLVFRILVAVAGIGFILTKVSITDQVEVPAGSRLPGGHTLAQTTTFDVIWGVYDPAEPAGELIVQIGTDGRGPQSMPIPQAALSLNGQDQKLLFVPGLIWMLRTADVSMLLLGLLTVAAIYPVLTVRWWLLMRARQIFVGLPKAFRLTMVGNFFNFCMPGTTGGDVVKAYYAAKGSGRRAEAVMSVVVDRVCGLLGLLLLAGVAGLFMLHNDVARQLTIYTWLIGLGVVVAVAVYFSAFLRRVLAVGWFLGKLPAQRALTAIDQAAFAYRHHKRTVLGAIVISGAIHAALIVATSLAGYALGMQTPAGLLAVVIPLTFLVGALPVAPPQGIGVMEFFALVMLKPPWALPNQVFGMLILIRLYQLFYSLFGSLFLLKGDIHLHPQEDPGEANNSRKPINRSTATTTHAASP